MTRLLIIRPEAEVDIAKASLWYEGRESGLGRDLVSEVHAAIKRALVAPNAFMRFRENPPVHRVLVRRFPYRVFYIVRPDSLVVFAVIHAARDEEYWKRRL